MSECEPTESIDAADIGWCATHGSVFEGGRTICNAERHKLWKNPLYKTVPPEREILENLIAELHEAHDRDDLCWAAISSSIDQAESRLREV